MLAGGSVAICGASAALAIASVLPFNKNRTKVVLFVVIGVTILSTISMIIYPILFKSLGMDEIESGYLIGATIHDIAQVVGAGYSISEESGIIATLIKMIRVTLLPIVMILVMYTLPGSQNSKVTLPSSKFKSKIVDVLKAEGYIIDYKINDDKKPSIEINLKYNSGNPVINTIERISKPGRRIFSSSSSLPKINNGLGIAIVSTPQGVMTDVDARKKKLGGEIICKVF